MRSDLPASLSVGTGSSLVKFADGRGFAGVGVMREEAAVSLPAHPMEEVPENIAHLSHLAASKFRDRMRMFGLNYTHSSLLLILFEYHRVAMKWSEPLCDF